jgi:hypothetical protein
MYKVTPVVKHPQRLSLEINAEDTWPHHSYNRQTIAPPIPLTQQEQNELLHELTGGIAPSDVSAKKTCILYEIKRKALKNRSIFISRHKQVEDSRIKIWAEAQL